jgi:hypothetical protein
MGKPKVINLRHTGGVVPEGAVRVDRKSRWGNPFHIGPHGTRADVVAKFRKFIENQTWIRQDAIEDLRGKDLACWCAPEACHGDVLLELANAAQGGE